MRLSLRFLVPLLLALGVFAWAAVPLSDALMLRWFVRDLDIRANLIANTVHEPLGELVASGSTINVNRYLSRIARDERIYAAALCRPGLPLPIATKDFPGDLRCDWLADYSTAGGKHVLDIPTGPLHVAAQASKSPTGRMPRWCWSTTCASCSGAATRPGATCSTSSSRSPRASR